MKKALLLVRIRTADRDAPHFRWRQGEHSHIETLQFTRALCELAPSPLLLGGTTWTTGWKVNLMQKLKY